MFTRVERLQTEIKKKTSRHKGSKTDLFYTHMASQNQYFSFSFLKESTKLLSRDVMSESITVTASLKYIVVLIIYKVHSNSSGNIFLLKERKIEPKQLLDLFLYKICIFPYSVT